MGNADKKAKVIGAVCFQNIEGEQEQELSFKKILLDETLVQGELWVDVEALSRAGGINHQLCAKKNYELCLRIAKKYRIIRADLTKKADYLAGNKYRHLQTDQEADSEIQGWKTDCYVISRYKKELLEMQSFDDAVKSILMTEGRKAAEYLEDMLSENDEYYRIYDNTQPVLIYVGDELCYNVLDVFARSLGRALQERGCSVIYFDMSKQKIDDITVFIGRRLKAVIGMQTYLFSVKQKDGAFLHDAIGAPEYFFVFDHPVWLRHHLTHVPKQMTVLTPDGNYAAFIEKYYGHKAIFFPPAGQEQFCGQRDRLYDISFLGTYRDSLLDELKDLRKNDKRKAYFVNRYILYMRQNIDETPEKALEKLLKYYRLSCSKENFEEQFFSVRWTILRLAHYYRRKVVETLLREGFTIHVFGDSWKNCPLCRYDGLIVHEQAIGEQAIRVYGNSKLSLNIMTWHKDGFTERIANALLQKSVVVTDRTTYLEQNFINDEEMLIFGLDKIKELPRRIRLILSDEQLRGSIAERGYKKAKEQHTWNKRAEDLLMLMK